MRRAAKVDTTQAAIVAGLRKLGVRVAIIGQPCDLLCRYWSHEHQQFLWQPLECKPRIGKRNPKARIRKDQPRQTAFLKECEVAIVSTPEEALRALGLVLGVM